MIELLKITRALKRFIERVKDYRLTRTDSVSGKEEKIGFWRSWIIKKYHPDLIGKNPKPKKK